MAFNNGKGITRRSNQNCLVGLLSGAHDLEVGRQEKAAHFERHENDRVIVSRRGQERALSPETAKAFTAYKQGTMAVSDRDLLLVTKAYPSAGLKTGDVIAPAKIDDHEITLPNGKTIPH